MGYFSELDIEREDLMAQKRVLEESCLNLELATGEEVKRKAYISEIVAYYGYTDPEKINDITSKSLKELMAIYYGIERKRDKSYEELKQESSDVFRL